jgi:HEAT repeat protein
MTLKDNLAKLFDADRSLRAAEQDLLSKDPGKLVELLAGATQDALALSDDQEAGMRLERLADLCAQVEGPEMVDTLIAILGSELPSVRVQAAEALVDVAFERYAEVARGVERALAGKAQGPSMQELPWVIVEVAEPSAIGLIKGFLTHDDVEVVASAVEALASLGNPAAAQELRFLSDDPRPVELDEYDGEVSATLGELVSEAIVALESTEGP